MRMKLDINSSPLKLEVGEIYPYKIEIHIAFALLALLLIASFSITALLAWFLAMTCFEILFLTKLLSNRDRSSKHIEKICINPFGITSNIYTNNQKMMKEKILSTLALFLLTSFITIINFGFSNYLSFNSNQSFIAYFLSSVLVISITNLIPMTNTTGDFALKKYFGQTYSRNNFFINYLPSIILLIVAMELQNFVLLITLMSMVLYGSAQKFKNKAIEAGATITIKEVFTPLEKIYKIKPKTMLRDALNILIRQNTNVASIFSEDQFKGLITKEDLLDNLSENLNENIENLALNNLDEISVSEKLEKAFKLIDESDLKVVKVISDEKLIGFIFRDVVYEFMLINNMIEKIDKADDLFGDDIF